MCRRASVRTLSQDSARLFLPKLQTRTSPQTGPARSYSSPEWDEKSGSSKTNRRPLETDWIFWTFRNSGQNSGQKSTEQNKSTVEQQKALKTNGFQGFDGGDKRDRTADLLNAILKLSTALAALRQRRLTMKKSCKSIDLPVFYVLLLYRIMP